MASFVSKGAMALALSILAFFPCSSEGRAQELTFNRESYYRAVDFCRRDASPGPMVLSPDKQILCFSGEVTPNLDLSLAVNFQEVVHPVPTEEAEVVEALAILRGTEWTFTRMRL